MCVQCGGNRTNKFHPNQMRENKMLFSCAESVFKKPLACTKSPNYSKDQGNILNALVEEYIHWNTHTEKERERSKFMRGNTTFEFTTRPFPRIIDIPLFCLSSMNPARQASHLHNYPTILDPSSHTINSLTTHQTLSLSLSLSLGLDSQFVICR